jgi:glycosyltransferase involved in cell wall biosynthesis
MEDMGIDSIDILISAFNGSNFIGRQIDSILGQTYENWQLIIRDDGSTDNTSEIIRKYQERYPGKIAAVLDGKQAMNVNLGASQGFARVLERSTAKYTMFCDQDDVWLPFKIEKTLEKMKGLEAIYQESTALMVHTDLRVVDRELNTIGDSLWQLQHLAPQNCSYLNRLLMQNGITGCTVMINRKLRELATPIPPEAIMHDYWLALAAAAFGRIAYLKAPTILYRQHGANDTGAKKYTIGFILKKSGDKSFVKDNLNTKQRQAKEFYRRYREDLSNRQKELLEDFLTLGHKGFWENRWMVLKNQFLPFGIARTAGLFFYL